MNTANRVTLIRIALIPVFLFFFLTDFIPYSNYIAVAVFLLAAVTDSVDGHIARKYNQITNFGKFIDPLADKILVMSALVGMVQFGQISALAVIIIIAREFMVTGLRIVAISSGRVIAAAPSGKLKTVVQIVVIAVVMTASSWIEAVAYLDIVLECLIWLMVLITVYSGAEYIVKNRALIDYRK